MREHQKILAHIHDLKMAAAHSRKGQLAEMVRISLTALYDILYRSVEVKTATRFGCCITVLVEEMLSSKVRQ